MSLHVVNYNCISIQLNEGYSNMGENACTARAKSKGMDALVNLMSQLYISSSDNQKKIIKERYLEFIQSSQSAP